MTFFAFNSLSSLLQKLEVVCLYTRTVVNRMVNNQASVQITRLEVHPLPNRHTNLNRPALYSPTTTQ